ncbi:MAG: preprotein translocase subunit YajC [Clostridia bacterium]|nr:preprotein translocase subunit YajC [Clostridia bacterium]
MDQNILMNLMLLVPIIIMFVVMTLSQKKKSKKEQELRNSIKIGDEITTIGGIVGTVISVKDESFVIKSQSESIRIKKWSVAAVNKAE